VNEPADAKRRRDVLDRPVVSWIVVGLVVFVVVVGGVVALADAKFYVVSDYLRDVTIVTAALALAAGGVHVSGRP
jgi:heme A synthase